MLDNDSNREKIYLDRLIRNIVARVEKINPEIGWEINLERQAIRVNPERIQVAIENILDNQLRYAESLIRIDLVQK